MANMTCSICDTSNNDTAFLVCNVELMMLKSPYWMGMDQPANGTIFPPRDTWKS